MKLIQRLIWPLAFVLFVLLMAPFMRAQSSQPGTTATLESPYHSRLYTLSVASLIGSNALDAASSYGKRERNPILGQRFDNRSVAIKSGVTAGGLVAQYFILRHHPEARKTAAIVNFAASGALVAVSVYNFRVKGSQ